MPVSSVNNVSSTGIDTTSAQGNSSLGKDAFMKLLVAQMSHQDPLKPMDSTAMVSQLAQFSALEQAVAQSQKLDLLSTQLTGLSNSSATDLVGKTVTVRGKAIAFDGTSPTGISVTLGGAATKTTVTIRDANGQAVRTIEMGPHGIGAMPIKWDGKDDKGQLVPAGSYTCDVSATNADGAKVTVSQDVTGKVASVSFDKGYPELTLESGAKAPVSDLVSVGASK
ncbi:MAG: flagellar hook assembly protein FlgD [Polyangiaceae bacterium]